MMALGAVCGHRIRWRIWSGENPDLRAAGAVIGRP
jgi:hypothetical protein